MQNGKNLLGFVRNGFSVHADQSGAALNQIVNGS